MRKSGKQNIELPQIVNRYQLQVQKEKDVVRPKLKKILYSPVYLSVRNMTNATLLQALVTKKSYQDVKDQKKESQIEQYLRQTKQILNRDQKYKSRIGRQAQLKYYQNYKNLDKLMGKKKLMGQSALLASIQQDPATLVLEATQNEKILPCCIGFVKSEGDASIINVKGQKFGDKYIKAISAGLKQSKMIQSCVFSNNRLTDIGLNQILKNLNPDIITLDLSHNRIAKTDQTLMKFLVQPQARLQKLNLQNNLLTDKAVKSLCQIAACSKRIRYLNIRKNLLTKDCAEAIGQLIQRSVSLQQLYIGMNRISEQGAIKILQAMQQNRNIKVFDYCMSKLGQSNPSCAKSVANLISTNKSLIHVDFSGNNFNQQQSKIIAEKLDKNKKIYGFHFSGNYGYVDSKGFLRMKNLDLTSLHSIMNRNINSYDINFRRQGSSFQPIRFTNVCWICQGWYQQTFRFVVPEPREDGKNFVYIHFDFEQFQPRLINITQTRVKYKAMVPPRRYRYFFSWNNMQFTQNCFLGGTNKSIGTDKHFSNHQSTQATMQLPLSYTYQINNQQINFKVQKVSVRTGKPKKIVNNWDQIIVSVLPRQQDLVTKKQKKQWSYKDSLWAKQWKLQDEQLTKNCFQKDWKSSKITNLVKNQNQQQKIKEILYKCYKLIKQLYRHFASWSPFNSDIWAVSSTTFTQFCHLAKIVSKETPLTIIDLTFITTNSLSNNQYKGNILVPERGLVRFRFMQAIVRLSEQKFKKNGLTDSILESVKCMIKDHVQPLADNPICNSEKWRLQKYFCEQNDMLIKKYRPIFSQLYKKNSKLKVKPGNKPFMCLAQFKSIIERIGIAGSQVLERDIFLSFNCSMMTQVDQLENQRFIRMTEIQFIQAVARCAYILPDTRKVQDFKQSPIPFYAKFQWIIHELKLLCSQDIKNMFFGTASIFNVQEDD